MGGLHASGYGQIPPEGGLLRNDTTKKFELGTVISDTLGNSYRYVKANEALAIGQVVTAVAKGVWDSTIVMDGASAVGDLYLPIDTTTTAMDANEYAGYFVSQATATGLGIGYQIKYHDAIAAGGEGNIYLERACQEIHATGVALLIYNPYLVELIDGAAELVMGVCVGTISSGSYGFIQVGGHCPAVAVGSGTATAITINEPLVACTTAPGSVMGVSGSTDADLMEVAATPLMSLQAVNADTTGYIEAFIKGLV